MFAVDFISRLVLILTFLACDADLFEQAVAALSIVRDDAMHSQSKSNGYVAIKPTLSHRLVIYWFGTLWPVIILNRLIRPSLPLLTFSVHSINSSLVRESNTCRLIQKPWLFALFIFDAFESWASATSSNRIALMLTLSIHRFAWSAHCIISRFGPGTLGRKFSRFSPEVESDPAVARQAFSTCSFRGWADVMSISEVDLTVPGENTDRLCSAANDRITPTAFSVAYESSRSYSSSHAFATPSNAIKPAHFDTWSHFTDRFWHSFPLLFLLCLCVCLPSLSPGSYCRFCQDRKMLRAAANCIPIVHNANCVCCPRLIGFCLFPLLPLPLPSCTIRTPFAAWRKRLQPKPLSSLGLSLAVLFVCAAICHRNSRLYIVDSCSRRRFLVHVTKNRSEYPSKTVANVFSFFDNRLQSELRNSQSLSLSLSLSLFLFLSNKLNFRHPLTRLPPSSCRSLSISHSFFLSHTTICTTRHLFQFEQYRYSRIKTVSLPVGSQFTLLFWNLYQTVRKAGFGF
jgi:hypothetical protein